MQMFVTDFFLLLVFASNDCKIEHKQPPKDLSDSDLQPQLPQARSHKRAVHTQHQNSFSSSFFNVLFF